MRYPWIGEYLLAKPGVNHIFKPEWGWHLYRLEEKMFAAVCLDESGRAVYITVKLSPMEGDFLRQQYEDILPGYYMNKVHWNSVRAEGSVPEELLKSMLDRSYELVLAGFSKKKQKEILGEHPPI